MGSLAVYARLVRAQLYSQMQYRASFLLQLFSTFSSTLVELLAILILFRTFGELGGWKVGEVAFLYGLVSIAFSFADMLGEGFERLSTQVRSGEFDRVLTRPLSPFMQIMASEFPLRRLGRVMQGILAVGLAQHWGELEWTPLRALVFGSAILTTALVFFSVLVIGAALCFWTVEGTEVQNVFTYGGTELASYPMHIYNRWLRLTFLFVMPLGITTYYPSLYILDKPDPLGLPIWVQFVAPVVAGAFFSASLLIWRLGTNHYQSTGS